MIRALRHFGAHGVLFALAKSSVLIAPLLAAAQLGAALYGNIEWWIALSLALAPLFGMGGHALVAYGTMGGPARRHARTAAVYTLQAAAVLVLLACVAAAFDVAGLRDMAAPLGLQCALVMLQLVLAGRLKAMGKGAWASVAESASYLCLLAALAVTALGASFMAVYLSCLAIACAVVAAALVRSMPLVAPKRWPRRNYVAFMAAGLRFTAAGLMVGAFMAAPRAWLGWDHSPEAVARFSIAFRWLSVAIVAHQFLNTVYFRQFYGERPLRERDRLLAATVALVAVATLAIAVALASPWATRLPLTVPAAQDRELVWPIAAAMVLWSATACLEGSLFRASAAVWQLRATAVALVAWAGALAALTGFGAAPVQAAAWAWICGFAAMIATQSIGLLRLDLGMPRLASTTASAVLIVLAIGQGWPA